MVGEIRDLETAEIAIKAAQTGHLVHVHAAHQRRAADAHAPRRHGREALCHRDLGQSHHCAAPGAPAVLAVQRRRRRACRSAAQGRLHAKQTSRTGIKIFGAEGLLGSAPTGTKGRVGIYQVMPVTEAIGRIIMEGGNAHQTSPTRPQREGVWDLRRAGLEKIKARA